MPDRVEVLFVCTANQCRSPMAEALLRHRVPGLVVASSGTRDWPGPATERAQRALARLGLDASGHRSRRVDERSIDSASLVIGLERAHVREVVVTSPDAFDKTFTLKELVRLAEAKQPRHRDESLDAWLRRIGADRQVHDLVDDDPEDDIADPVGQSQKVHDACAEELDDLIDRLARRVFDEVQTDR